MKIIGANVLEDAARKLGTLLVKTYCWTIKPLLAPNCRYYPSCSQYALISLDNHKFPTALRLIMKRLLKCNPLGPGGYDPVPCAQNTADKICPQPCEKQE